LAPAGWSGPLGGFLRAFSMSGHVALNQERGGGGARRGRFIKAEPVGIAWLHRASPDPREGEKPLGVWGSTLYMVLYRFYPGFRRGFRHGFIPVFDTVLYVRSGFRLGFRRAPWRPLGTTIPHLHDLAASPPAPVPRPRRQEGSSRPLGGWFRVRIEVCPRRPQRKECLLPRHA